MKVKKRDGRLEDVSFDKVLNRLKYLIQEFNLTIDASFIAQKVCGQIYDGVKTSDLDEFAAELCISMLTDNPDYGILASTIIISNNHKNTSPSFSEVISELYDNKDVHGEPSPIIDDKLYKIVKRHHKKINASIKYDRDYLLDYFGFKTLERSYLLRKNNEIMERPQHMWMRVALGIHGRDIKAAIETYNMMSQKYFTHASPTLFNCGTPHNQLSSCFLENTEVLTINEGVKKIQDIKIGDEVITHKGNIKKVLQIHKNLLNNRKIKELKVNKTKKIYVTEDHKFWSIKYKKYPNKYEYKDINWFSLNELKPTDYISIPNYKNDNENINIDIIKYLDEDFLNDCIISDDKIMKFTHFNHSNLLNVDSCKVMIKSNEINRIWNIDEHFANFIGIFLGDGHIIKNKNKIRGIGFTVYNKNVKEINFLKDLGEKVFGIKSSIHKMKNQNIIQVLFNSEIIGKSFYRLFGQYFNQKKLHKIVFSFPTKSIYGLLAGLITSDGCITKQGFISVTMCNKKLINQLYHLFRLHNIDISINKVKKPSKLSKEQPYTLGIPRIKEVLDKTMKYYNDNRMDYCYKQLNTKFRNQNTPVIINNSKFLRIESIKDIDLIPKYVYTLGIEDDHSYNVEGLIAQNCFLLGTDDSIDGIYKTISDCGRISKYAGGLGIHISNIRAKGSRIRGTNGISDGIIPMLKVYNETCRYVNQSGRRKGSFAMYVEPWHADFEDFLDIRKNHGDENMRARDLFTAVWMCDLFMKRVEKNALWSMMCPDECPGLTNTFGDEFELLYKKYEKEGRYRKQVKARDLWFKILTSQIETGTPYILYKDAINKKSNQANLGVIKSSNLCAEITIYSDTEQYGVCNLASIAVSMFVNKDKTYDFEKLKNIAKICCKNLNKIIDLNFYPTPETKKSNMENRPIGIGIQGLADAFIKMRYEYDSKEALLLNKKISETIYYGALEASCEIAKDKGAYKTYKGSPISEGKFQWELWGDKPTDLWNWKELREKIKEHGVRNSLTTAYMPTASTSQILGNNECFEAITSNIYVRRTLAGEFVVINKYLMKDLVELGIWNRGIKDRIIADRGSVQNIKEIPQDIKGLYKTVWEISQKAIINLARIRAPFIDQTQSMNLFVADPSFKNLSSMHFYAWKQGVKTGIYYLRTRPKATAQQFTIDPKMNNKEKEKKEVEQAKLMCSIKNPEACEMCSS